MIINNVCRTPDGKYHLITTDWFEPESVFVREERGCKHSERPFKHGAVRAELGLNKAYIFVGDDGHAFFEAPVEGFIPPHLKRAHDAGARISWLECRPSVGAAEKGIRAHLGFVDGTEVVVLPWGDPPLHFPVDEARPCTLYACGAPIPPPPDVEDARKVIARYFHERRIPERVAIVGLKHGVVRGAMSPAASRERLLAATKAAAESVLGAHLDFSAAAAAAKPSGTCVMMGPFMAFVDVAYPEDLFALAAIGVMARGRISSALEHFVRTGEVVCVARVGGDQPIEELE